jgi:hypothetical protein
MPAKPKAKPRSAKVVKGGTKTYDNRLYREFERGDTAIVPPPRNRRALWLQPTNSRER